MICVRIGIWKMGNISFERKKFLLGILWGMDSKNCGMVVWCLGFVYFILLLYDDGMGDEWVVGVDKDKLIWWVRWWIEKRLLFLVVSGVWYGWVLYRYYVLCYWYFGVWCMCVVNWWKMVVLISLVWIGVWSFGWGFG